MQAVPSRSVLSELALFRGLPPAQLDRLRSVLRVREFRRQSNVLTIDEPAEDVYILLEGTVKICIERDGADAILAICGAGELLGEISVMDGLGHSANVVTLEDSTFLWMPGPTFCEILRTEPTVTHNLATLLAGRLRRASTQTESLVMLDVPGRVANQLLRFAREYGRSTDANEILIPIRLTQRDLAHITGASRESVNKALAFYRRTKVISVDPRHYITIHKAPVLQKRCGCAPTGLP